MKFFIILAYNSEILSKFAEAKKNLMKHIKTALIGFGYRGKQLLRLLRTIESYEIVGIADINGCGDSESPGASFYQGEEAYKMMLDEQQPNLVFITPPGTSTSPTPQNAYCETAMWLSKSKADSARMNMPRYRKSPNRKE